MRFWCQQWGHQFIGGSPAPHGCGTTAASPKNGRDGIEHQRHGPGVAVLLIAASKQSWKETCGSTHFRWLSPCIQNGDRNGSFLSQRPHQRPVWLGCLAQKHNHNTQLTHTHTSTLTSDWSAPPAPNNDNTSSFEMTAHSSPLEKRI